MNSRTFVSFVPFSLKPVFKEKRIKWDYYYLFEVGKILANTSKNQLKNIKTFIKENKKNYFLQIIGHRQSILNNCFKLVLNSIIGLLDFMELCSWFKISVPRKSAGFVPWVVDLACGRKITYSFSNYMELPFLWRSATWIWG